MAKIKYIEQSYKDVVYSKQYFYMCCGCGYSHAIGIDVHKFNGDFDKPTFSPSLLQNFTPGKICHSFIVDGMIQYLNDCTHELAGQTIELPEWKDEYER